MKSKIIDSGYELLKNSLSKENEELTFLLSIITLYNKDKEIVNTQKTKIIKSIKQLLNRFDNTYLLFYKLDEHKNRIFLENENSIFILFADKLEMVLNTNNFINEADIINGIKSKIELGYDRYFNQNEKLVKEFNKNTFEFSIANKDEELSENPDLIDYLIILHKLKENKNSIKEKIKKIEEILPYFPQYVYFDKTRYEFEIYKSLFPHQEDTIIELKKQKVHIENTNNILVAILTINLSS